MHSFEADEATRRIRLGRFDVKPRRARPTVRRQFLRWAGPVALLAGLTVASSQARADGKVVRIGVTAWQGKDFINKSWKPMTEYLAGAVPGYAFEVLPLSLPESTVAVEQAKVDFVVTNPGHYATLEFLYGITRMATMRNRTPTGEGFTRFGSVVFVRAAAENIRSVADLKGRSFMAVDADSFGGHWMAQGLLLEHGVPERDLRSIQFSGFPQDIVVRAVGSGTVDAGTVRTGELERMAAKGEIKLADFRVLNQRVHAGYPYLVSTDLYPEFAFASLATTDQRISQQVAVALLSLPADHPAAKAMKSTGWTVPLDYGPVHELMKRIHAGPYTHYGEITLVQALRQYWKGLLALLLGLVAMSVAMLWVLRLNRRIGEQKAGMNLVLNNVGQGFLTIDRAGTMSTERSAIVEKWFGPAAPGMTLAQYLLPKDPAMVANFKMAFEAVIEDFLPLALNIEQMPKRMTAGSQVFGLEYSPILDEHAKLSRILVVITDLTAAVEGARLEAEQREMMQVFERIMNDKPAFLEFLAEADSLFGDLGKPGIDAEREKRILHTIKGNAALFGLSNIAAVCHTVETHMSEQESRASASDKQDLIERWNRLRVALQTFLGDRLVANVEIEDVEYEKVLAAVLSGVAKDKVAEMIRAWKLEPLERRLGRIGDQAKAIAQRLNKGQIVVDIQSGGLRLEPEHWAPFWSAFVHVIRNAIDHGLEEEEERTSAGKPANGRIALRTVVEGDRFVIEVRDDGRGINWEAVSAAALRAGLPHDTRDQLVAALFSDGLTTRDAVTDYSGRGVGLAAVRTAVTERGGIVRVETESGKGTLFRFSFPTSEMGRASRRPVALAS